MATAWALFHCSQTEGIFYQTGSVKASSNRQRQCNLYGFKRITKGPDRNAYYHNLFLRGKPFLSERIPRIKIKGQGSRKAADPENEPNFYLMPTLPEPRSCIPVALLALSPPPPPPSPPKPADPKNEPNFYLMPILPEPRPCIPVEPLALPPPPPRMPFPLPVISQHSVGPLVWPPPPPPPSLAQILTPPISVPLPVTPQYLTLNAINPLLRNFAVTPGVYEMNPHYVQNRALWAPPPARFPTGNSYITDPQVTEGLRALQAMKLEQSKMKNANQRMF